MLRKSPRCVGLENTLCDFRRKREDERGDGAQGGFAGEDRRPGDGG
jgi:hypothetical protein